MADAEEFEATITIAHFNDVYHISNATRIARFSTTIRAAKPDLTIFSGDAFSPSLESSILKGGHIVPVLNHLGIDVACYGNHDFDLGEQRLVELSAQCNFPWVLSNARSPGGTLLASAHPHIFKEVGPLRVGFFGLAGTDWPSNCQHLPSDAYIGDPAECSTHMVAHLREEHGADIVIAVTHMRMEEDMNVASRCPDVDLILGGHDHEHMLHGSRYIDEEGHAEGNIRIVKSGTDFREFSIVKAHIKRYPNNWRVRMVEGTRSSRLLKLDIVPFDNPWVVKRVSGQLILQALENSVSNMRSDGRFLQLSGLSIVVDLSRPEGKRILYASLPSGAPLAFDADYTVTMQRFIAEGFDGYIMFRNAVNLVDLEAAMTDTSLLMALLSPERRHGADDASDRNDEMLDRAARAIVVGTREGLSVLSPVVNERIRTV
ncbi:Metallo-dependent phosphatase-like protein [Schizophyllum commune]